MSKTIAAVIAMVICLPIWYYLLYKILEAVSASELMWFLFWTYVPATALVTALTRLAEDRS